MNPYSSEHRVLIKEAVSRAVSGRRDQQAMQTAQQSMDRIREEIRRTHGELNIGVPAFREIRDAE